MFLFVQNARVRLKLLQQLSVTSASPAVSVPKATLSLARVRAYKKAAASARTVADASGRAAHVGPCDRILSARAAVARQRELLTARRLAARNSTIVLTQTGANGPAATALASQKRAG